MTFCFTTSDNPCLRVDSKLLIFVAVVSVLACHCSFAILQSFTFPDNFDSASGAISIPQFPHSELWQWPLHLRFWYLKYFGWRRLNLQWSPSILFCFVSLRYTLFSPFCEQTVYVSFWFSVLMLAEGFGLNCTAPLLFSLLLFLRNNSNVWEIFERCFGYWWALDPLILKYLN